MGRSAYFNITIAASVVLLSLQLCSASYLIPGSKFPFEGCKLRPNYNRWTLDMIEYVEDYVKGSRACFRFGLKPVDECMAAAEAEDVRCCVNDKKTNATTNLNKFKMFIDPLCQRSDIYNMSLNGVQTTAAFKEYMGDVEDQATLKITNMFIPYDDIPNSVLCFNLRGTRDKGNCPTLYELSNPVARVEGKLEVGLYDKKAGYECCPMFAIDVIKGPPGYVDPTPPPVRRPPPPPPARSPPPPPVRSPPPPPVRSPPPPPTRSPPPPPARRPPSPKAACRGKRCKSPPPPASPPPSPPPSPPKPCSGRKCRASPPPPGKTATDTPTTTTTNAFLTFRALGHRYDLFIGVTTIGQAEAACVANGGHLVSILGTQEWTAVQNRLARGTYATLGVSYLDLWMGLSVNLNAGLFWTDGSALDYAPLGAPGVTDGTCYSMMCSPTAGQAATGSTCTWQAATAAQGGCRSATKDGYLCKTDI